MYNNEWVNLCVDFIYLPIHPCQRTEVRFLWKSSLIYLCLNAAAVSSLQSLWYCWPLVSLVTTHDLSCLHPLPPASIKAFLLFWHIEILGEWHSLPKGLPANPCKLQMFSQAAHSEETFSIPCKHLSDKSLCHGGDTSLEWVKWLH